MPLSDDTRLDPGPATQPSGTTAPSAPAPASSRRVLWVRIALVVVLLGLAVLVHWR